MWSLNIKISCKKLRGKVKRSLFEYKNNQRIITQRDLGRLQGIWERSRWKWKPKSTEFVGWARGCAVSWELPREERGASLASPCSVTHVCACVCVCVCVWICVCVCVVCVVCVCVWMCGWCVCVCVCLCVSGLIFFCFLFWIQEENNFLWFTDSFLFYVEFLIFEKFIFELG